MSTITPLHDWLRHPAGMLSESHRALEDALAHETLVSERLRVPILIGLFGLIGITALILFSLFPDLPLQVLRGQRPGVIVSLIVGAAFGCELLARTVFGFFMLIKCQPPFVSRYIHALIETSFPTLLLVVAAHIVGPALALLTSPSLLYFLFWSGFRGLRGHVYRHRHPLGLVGG